MAAPHSSALCSPLPGPAFLLEGPHIHGGQAVARGRAQAVRIRPMPKRLCVCVCAHMCACVYFPRKEMKVVGSLSECLEPEELPVLEVWRFGDLALGDICTDLPSFRF